MIDCTFALKAFAKYRRAQLNAQDPVATQEAQLRWLLSQAAQTRFGREYDFSTIRTVGEYQSRVPLRKYEDFWRDYWEQPFPRLDNITWPGLMPYFSWTSGTTTGKRKFIPYSNEMVWSYNKGGRDLLVHHVLNRPDSKIFGGKSFMLGATTKVTEECPGVYVGEVSGISAKKLPFWAKPFFFPPKELSDITDWIKRTEAIAKASAAEDIRLIGGMPSWLLIFLEKFKDTHGSGEGLLHRLYPNLELFVHGGVKFDPYLKQYQSLLSGSRAEFREIYPASEAFMAVADRGYGEGLRLALDTHIFYEFVPVDELAKPNPTRHWIKNVEPGVNYAIILTTCSGSWSYIIGDTVRFIDTKVPRILITGRTSYSMSAFGEHLINEEIEKAIAAGAEAVNNSVVDYTLGVDVHATIQPGELGRHLYFVEFSRPIASEGELRTFRDKVDQVLLGLNDDYADHRAPGCGVLEPAVSALVSGGFAKWMESKGKLGDQHKVPRIMNDRELFSGLAQFCGEQRLVQLAVR